MTKKRMDERNSIFVLAVFLKIMIEFGYGSCIGSVFNYMGVDIKFNIIKYIFSWFVALVVIFFECYVLKKDYLWIVNSFFLIFSYIPSSALMGIKNGYSWGSIFAIALYCIIMNVACYILQRRYRGEYYKPNLELNKYVNKVKLLILSSFIFVILFHHFFAPTHFFISFEDALDVRLEMRKQYIPALFRYSYMILGNALLPVFFILVLKYRKKVYILFVIIASYLLYTVHGMKTWILIYILLIGLYFICKYKSNNLMIIKCFFVGGIALWGIGIMEYKVIGSHYIVAYLHRAMTVPAELHNYYYDFIIKNEYLYLRESIGRFLFKQPYGQTVSGLIGCLYYGRETMNATNGMFSDAFMNFGYLGLLIYPFIIFWCFSFLGKTIKTEEKFIQFGITIVLLIVLYDNPFFTWLLTGGYIFTVVSLKLIYKVVIKFNHNVIGR